MPNACSTLPIVESNLGGYRSSVMLYIFPLSCGGTISAGWRSAGQLCCPASPVDYLLAVVERHAAGLRVGEAEAVGLDGRVRVAGVHVQHHRQLAQLRPARGVRAAAVQARHQQGGGAR